MIEKKKKIIIIMKGKGRILLLSYLEICVFQLQTTLHRVGSGAGLLVKSRLLEGALWCATDLLINTSSRLSSAAQTINGFTFSTRIDLWVSSTRETPTSLVSFLVNKCNKTLA